MRTLAEIVADVENGESPSYEELFYALAVLSALGGYDGVALLHAADGTTTDHVQAFRDHALRVRSARAARPDEFLGWDSDPKNPEHQERRRAIAGQLRRTLH